MTTPFDLEVTFYGLCLFVPDDAATRNTGGFQDPAPGIDLVHVLLVEFGHHHNGSKKPHHHPCLLFDSAFLSGDQNDENELLKCTKLEKKWVQLVDGLDNGPKPMVPLPSELADLNGMADVPSLPPAFLYGDPGSPLGSRITLRAGLTYDVRPTAPFSTDREDLTNPRQRTARVTVSLKGAGDLSKWNILTLDGSPLTPVATLKPVQGKVRMAVYNSAMEDIPPADRAPRGGRKREPADHFEGYFELFPDSPRVSLWLAEAVDPLPAGSCVKSECKSKDCKGGVKSAGAEFPAIRIPQTVTCIMARAIR